MSWRDLLTPLPFTRLLSLNLSAVKCSWLYKGDEQRVNKWPLQATENAAGVEAGVGRGWGDEDEGKLMWWRWCSVIYFILQRGPPVTVQSLGVWNQREGVI